MTLYAVTNPATGLVVAEYPAATESELTSALDQAEGAYQTWARGSSVAERAGLIARVADLHEERRDVLADIIVREMGKPRAQALGEIDFSAAIYRFYADNAAALVADEPITLLAGEGTAVVRRSSLGVLLGIMPWNFPYYQVARFAGPNLVVGNTIVLKHAPQCPESAAAIAAIFADAGFPPGAYVNIYATNEQIERVIADPRVRGVSLTGSARAGSQVAALAGKHLKKVVLELGGSDPFIVLDTDNLDAVVESAVAARLDNSGQSCNAAKRFVVIDHLYDEFLEKFAAAFLAATPGDPGDDSTALGPLSSLAAAERLQAQVDRAVAEGAELHLAPGSRLRHGAFFSPAILTNVLPGTEAYGEEFFGPVAQVYRAASEAEAIRIANDTPYGLGSYLFTNDAAQAERVAAQIEAGMVYVNLVLADGAELPFGGVKNSGFGRELGRYGADEFVNKKLVRQAPWA